MKLNQVERCPRSIGKKEMVKHLKGGKLTHRQRMLAKCFECMGGYADGTHDCHIPDCALYPAMPYRDQSHKTPVSCSPNPLNPVATGTDNHKPAQ